LDPRDLKTMTQQPSVPDASDRRQLRLLLVEDQENDAELLLVEVERLGYDVTCERVDTRESMAKALDQEWDLIISDYNLPEFDGPRALELCNERKVDLPFIILSGTVSEEEAVESMRLGAADFIAKGRLARLGPAIARSLRERAERRALKAAEDRLRQAQKIDAIGQLAGGVAHDFNNLLGVVMGYGEMILKALPPGDRQRSRAEQILVAASRGAALTRQLLAFSRQQPMEARVLELASAVSNVEKMLARLIGENIEIITVSDRRGGRVMADPTQIEQVVMNLAINARDAMPAGGCLTIETANVELDAASHPDAQPGPYVSLVVSDNGTGISAETLAHIYEPFFTTKESGQGTGLGLATVYGIVRQSGGHLTVDSEVGQGTSFKVYLPRVEAAATEPPDPASASTTMLGTETVLLLEDEVALRRVISDQLSEAGYHVMTADGVDATLEAAGKHEGRIHLLITDIVMPRISGPDALKRIRMSRPDIRVIYMSGYGNLAAALNGLSERREAFLRKPFSLEALLRKTREVLDAPARPGAD
jgi:two-component system cell cycle sensor histidine kinase/response regulator CckA